MLPAHSPPIASMTLPWNWCAGGAGRGEADQANGGGGPGQVDGLLHLRRGAAGLWAQDHAQGC